MPARRCLDDDTSCHRDYYGSVRHNAKGIYQKYLGWYDDNPANLDPLPPVEGAEKYIAYMGGAVAVIRREREDFRNGEAEACFKLKARRDARVRLSGHAARCWKSATTSSQRRSQNGRCAQAAALAAAPKNRRHRATSERMALRSP
jgi:Alkyl sulfatase dimerisation